MTEQKLNALLITGASSGIGEACALKLDELGFLVFAGVLSDEEGKKLKKKASHRLITILIDVTDTDSISAAVDIITSKVGEQGLFGLINSGGVGIFGPLEFIPVKEFRKQIEINVIGQLAVTQKFLHLLRKRHGRIVNIGSACGEIAYPYFGPYCASKFALKALTDSLRMELEPWGINVSIIESGNVKTQFLRNALRSFEDMVNNFSPHAIQLYDFAINHCRELAKNINGIPVDHVVQAVIHALLAEKPKKCYLIGREAKLMFALSRMPGKIQTLFVKRSLDRYY